MPTWKVKILKEKIEQSTFDLDEIKKESLTCCVLVLWLKAVLHEWNSISEMVKTEKNFS